MLVPSAVIASVCSSSSIGTAKTLIAKAKAAKTAPTRLPTKSSAQPVGVVRQHRHDLVHPGKVDHAEKQRVDQHRRPHPEQEESKQQAPMNNAE